MIINEIFQSIDGEGPTSGQLANFIRLTGCNLRCSYCDTTYAFTEGTDMDVQQIIDQLSLDIPNVTITGGEPLIHEPVKELLQSLINLGYNISIETNGSIDLEPFIKQFPKVRFIMDYKCPSSGEENKMNLHNFKVLREHDVVKYVVGTSEDLIKSEHLSSTYDLYNRNVPVYISPIYGEINLEEIVEFMKTNNMKGATLQVQLHKIIWSPDKRGV